MSTPAINNAGAGADDRAKLKQAVRVARAAALIIVLAAAGFVAYRYYFSGPAVPPGVIQVSGRIEGDDAVVASKTSGRIREITVREGDEVKAGQVIARSEEHS